MPSVALTRVPANELAVSSDVTVPHNARFPKSARILRRADFLRVQRQQQRFTTPRVVILALATDGPTRFGFTVSKKVGNAVTRNKVKRRLREIVRLHKPGWPPHHDVVIIARAAAAEADYETLRRDVVRWSRWFHKNRS